MSSPPEAHHAPMKEDDYSGNQFNDNNNNNNTNNNNNNNNNNNQENYQFRQDQYYNLDAKGDTAPIGNSFEEIFPDDKPHYNDWPFTIIFLITCCGFVAIAGLVLHGWASSSDAGSTIYNSTSTGTLNSNAAILLVFACVIALIFSYIGFITCQKWPKKFIYIGMIVNIVSGLGTAIMYLSLRYWSAGIVFLVMTCITAWCYWGMRSRIPLSVEILTTVMDVIKWYPTTLFASFLGTLVAGAFGFFFSLVIAASYMKYDPKQQNSEACAAGGGGCSYSKLIGVLVVVFFCGYYISEVIKNVLHTTIAGVYGCWYYMAKSDQGPPKRPLWGSFKRSITYCFGSICFGSLIVSLIETARSTLQLIRNTIVSDSQWATIGFFIIDLIIGFINWLAQYFNHYAYAFIACYGKNYIRSAKETYHMLREKGIDALINDNLIGIALGFYSLFVAYMSALFAYLYLRFTTPSYNSNGSYTAPLVAFSFVIALQLSNIVNETIKSGDATFFICLGNDPEVFMKSYPDRFDRIVKNYPDVLHKLSHQNV